MATTGVRHKGVVHRTAGSGTPDVARGGTLCASRLKLSKPSLSGSGEKARCSQLQNHDRVSGRKEGLRHGAAPMRASGRMARILGMQEVAHPSRVTPSLTCISCTVSNISCTLKTTVW